MIHSHSVSQHWKVQFKLSTLECKTSGTLAVLEVINTVVSKVLSQLPPSHSKQHLFFRAKYNIYIYIYLKVWQVVSAAMETLYLSDHYALPGFPFMHARRSSRILWSHISTARFRASDSSSSSHMLATQKVPCYCLWLKVGCGCGKAEGHCLEHCRHVYN